MRIRTQNRIRKAKIKRDIHTFILLIVFAVVFFKTIGIVFEGVEEQRNSYNAFIEEYVEGLGM